MYIIKGIIGEVDDGYIEGSGRARQRKVYDMRMGEGIIGKEVLG